MFVFLASRQDRGGRGLGIADALVAGQAIALELGAERPTANNFGDVGYATTDIGIAVGDAGEGAQIEPVRAAPFLGVRTQGDRLAASRRVGIVVVGVGEGELELHPVGLQRELGIDLLLDLPFQLLRACEFLRYSA
jgi:hypothetical protein